MVFGIWEGGMASHGGFIGVALALAWIARRFKISFLRLGDLLCPIVPPGLFLGRIANFINGELWGKPSNLPWAVIFSAQRPAGAHRSSSFRRAIPRSFTKRCWKGVVLFIFTQWRFWRGNAPATPGAAQRRVPGALRRGADPRRAIPRTRRRADPGPQPGNILQPVHDRRRNRNYFLFPARPKALITPASHPPTCLRSVSRLQPEFEFRLKAGHQTFTSGLVERGLQNIHIPMPDKIRPPPEAVPFLGRQFFIFGPLCFRSGRHRASL